MSTLDMQSKINEWLINQMPFNKDKILIPLMKKFDLNSREAIEAISAWQDIIWEDDIL